MRIHLKRATWLLSAALAVATPALIAAPQSTPPPAAATKSKAATPAPAPAASAPTAKEIEAAKAKGMVWVNTNTKIFHRDGQFYGATKHGQFMTEADALKAGYKSAKAPAVKAKK